jgi:hypothetical protein
MAAPASVFIGRGEIAFTRIPRAEVVGQIADRADSSAALATPITL